MHTLTHSSLATGSSSHKTVTQDVSRILWYYYNDSRTLFVFCFANETFFVCLYLNKYWSKPLQHSLNIPDAWLDALVQVSPELFKWTSWLIKNVTWPQLVGAITFPICAGKQMINVVQFWKASKIVSLNHHAAESSFTQQAFAICSGAQLCEGMRSIGLDLISQLVGIDLAERQAAREAKYAKSRQ